MTGVVILDTVSSLFSAPYTPPMAWAVAAGGEGQPGSPPLSPGPEEPIAVDEMSRQAGRGKPRPRPQKFPRTQQAQPPIGFKAHLVDALGQGGPRWSQQVPAPGEAQQPGSLEGGGWACVGKAGAWRCANVRLYLLFQIYVVMFQVSKKRRMLCTLHVPTHLLLHGPPGCSPVFVFHSSLEWREEQRSPLGSQAPGVGVNDFCFSPPKPRGPHPTYPIGGPSCLSGTIGAAVGTLVGQAPSHLVFSPPRPSLPGAPGCG